MCVCLSWLVFFFCIHFHFILFFLLFICTADIFILIFNKEEERQTASKQVNKQAKEKKMNWVHDLHILLLFVSFIIGEWIILVFLPVIILICSGVCVCVVYFIVNFLTSVCSGHPPKWVYLWVYEYVTHFFFVSIAFYFISSSFPLALFLSLSHSLYFQLCNRWRKIFRKKKYTNSCG